MENNGGKREIFDFNKHRQMIAKNRTILIVLVSLLALALSAVAYFIVSAALSPQIKEYVLELTYDVDDNTSYSYFKNKIVALNSSGMKIYDPDGLVSFRKDAYISNPVLNVSGKNILAYDSGGTALFVTDGSNVKLEKNFESGILKAKFGSDGDLIVITKADGYKALVTVYNRYFEEIYRWSSSSEYVADADVTENGKTLAVASYIGEDAKIISSISYFDLADTQRKGRIDGLSGLPYSLDFKKSLSLHLLTSDALYHAGEDFSANQLYAFDSTYLQYFAADKSHVTALAVNKSIVGEDSDLLLFEENSLLRLMNVDNAVRSVDISEKYIAVLTGSTATVYTLDGDEHAKATTTEQAKDIIVSDSGDMIVFDLDKVTLVK